MTYILPYGAKIFNSNWQRANQGGVPQFTENLIVDDTKWNRTLFEDEKARNLLQLYLQIEPCIKKCIISKYSCAEEMACDYCRVYLECRHIIMKNMKQYNYPPSMFSAAVHSYIMHQGLNSQPMWRIICAVFDYTSMEISAMLSAQQETQRQQIQQEQGRNVNAIGVTHWGWPAVWPAAAKHPHEIMHETHATVQQSHAKLENIQERLEEVLKAMRQNKP
jgi:hypothetical protein